jgi:diadenosine tetraphosphatase ApaH/serine/threonine PP2A family protein phosphatase
VSGCCELAIDLRQDEADDSEYDALSNPGAAFMRTALLADIHANREALSACLAHAQASGTDRYVFLGDYVGYGADPGWAIDTVMAHVDAGAIAVLGNHDAAVFDPNEDLNETASIALAWTREQLTDRQRNFLEALPLTAEIGDRLFVHASACAPGSWDYVTGPRAASRSFAATRCRVTSCGHVHVPELYHLSVTGKIGAFTPEPATAIPLTPQRRWLAVIGSVGQPRDGVAAASYALMDDDRLTYMRVPYDVDSAAAKVRAAGLPAVLSLRLLAGR